MKRLIAGLLLAGLLNATAAHAVDPHVVPATILPTTPQTPAPVLGHGGTIQASGVSGTSRVIVPLRDRVSTTPARSDAPPNATPMPLPTGYAGPQTGPYSGYSSNGRATGDCGGCAAPRARGAYLDRIKGWLCFRPTAGDALPVFNPHPYVGPVVGIFPCSSTAGCGSAAGCATGSCGNGNGCGTPNGCASGNGCAAADTGRGGLAARFGLGGSSGCRAGCVTPADDAIPGYRFAGYRAPATPATAGSFTPLGYTTYKPAAPVAGQPVQQVQSVAKPTRTDR